MIISIAVSSQRGIWTCCEDFESVEEGVLYAKRRLAERGFNLHTIRNVVTAPLRATGLVLADEIGRSLRREFRI